jgi:tetratricopeptide (TPR) repeat protein
MMARALETDGRIDEALSELRIAVELDPLFSRLADNYSLALIHAGRLEEALVWADRALALQPENGQAMGAKATALVMLGRGAEGVAVARTLEPDRTYGYIAAFAFALAGDRAAAERILAKRPLSGNDADTLAALGRYDDVIATLQSGSLAANRADRVYFYPCFDPIREDPRFRKALADSGALEAHDRAQAWRKAHPPEKPAPK